MQEPQGLLSRKNENKHIVVSLNYALILLVMSDNKYKVQKTYATEGGSRG